MDGAMQALYGLKEATQPQSYYYEPAKLGISNIEKNVKKRILGISLKHEKIHNK